MPVDHRLRGVQWLERLLPQTPVARLSAPQARIEFDRAMRLAGALLFGRRRRVAAVRDLVLHGTPGPLRARLYRPTLGRDPLPVLLFFHGGGWVIGSIATHDKMARSLAQQSGVAVLSVDYRLAPEHPYPAAVEDAYAALLWTRENAADYGLDGTRLAVTGDSAGGNLAAAVCLMTRDRGGPSIRTQVLFYPGLDTRLSTPSYTEFKDGFWLSADRARWFLDQYAGSSDRELPYLSPGRAKSLQDLPEALIITAELDVLRDEGERYAEALRAEGVSAELYRFDGVFHGFSMMEGLLPQARRSVSLAARHVARALA